MLNTCKSKFCELNSCKIFNVRRLNWAISRKSLIFRRKESWLHCLLCLQHLRQWNVQSLEQFYVASIDLVTCLSSCYTVFLNKFTYKLFYSADAFLFCMTYFRMRRTLHLMFELFLLNLLRGWSLSIRI